MQKPGFWDDQQRARVRRPPSTAARRGKLESFRELESEIDDLAGLAELAEEDESLRGRAGRAARRASSAG